MAAPARDSTLDTLQKLQAQLPPHLARRDLAELAVLLRYAERGAWAFAVYNTVPVRDEVAGVLRELLAPLRVYEFTLSPQRSNPLDCLDSIPADQGRAIAFFFDLEQTDGVVWQYLEMQRENLAVRPLGLVFWINWPAWQEGVRAAPNFWSQRSGVFDFTIESPAVRAEVRGAWAGQAVQLESPDDWERQMRLFSGVLREYEAEQAPPAAQADLHGKIAYLLYFADRQDQAADHLQQQLALAQAAGDRQQQARAMNNLGHIVRIQQGRLAALEWYERALAAAGDDPPGRAESLQNMASVLLWEGETERAEKMLDEALGLFRAVGARLGEANTLKAIGDVQQFRKAMDAALESYGQALGLFRAVGARLGEANTLKAIGDVQRFRDERDAALESYGQALGLFRAVGDRLGEANTLQAIGDMQQFRDERDAALESYGQALGLFRAVGARLGEANTLKAIGDVQRSRAGYDAAMANYVQALDLYRAIGARLGEANTLQTIGSISATQGQFSAALEHYRNSLAIAETIGDLHGQANALTGIAQLLATAEPETAYTHYQHALDIYQRTGDGYSVARTLYNLGLLHHHQGVLEQAFATLSQSAEMFTAIGLTQEAHTVCVARAEVAYELGQQYVRQGRWYDGLCLLEDCLAVRRLNGDLDSLADVIYQIGVTRHLIGNTESARIHYRDALRLYERSGNRQGVAASKVGLGRLAIQAGMLSKAVQELEQARCIYKQLDDTRHSEEIEKVLQLTNHIQERQPT